MRMRLGAVSAAVLFSGLTAVAQPASAQALDTLSKCASMSNAAQRLACYDAAMPQAKQELANPPQVVQRPPTQQEQESWFGFKTPNLFGSSAPQVTPDQFGRNSMPAQAAETLAARQPTTYAANAKEIDSITAGVSKFSFNQFGNFLITLDNGQVWRQMEGDSGRAQFKSKSPNVVNISRGFWDSYNLKIQGSSGLYKVARVK